MIDDVGDALSEGEMGLKNSRGAFQRLAGGAEPGAQRGSVVSRAMVRMMCLVWDDLRIHEPGEHKQADNQDGRQAFLKRVRHITGRMPCAKPPH